MVEGDPQVQTESYTQRIRGDMGEILFQHPVTEVSVRDRNGGLAYRRKVKSYRDFFFFTLPRGRMGERIAKAKAEAQKVADALK